MSSVKDFEVGQRAQVVKEVAPAVIGDVATVTRFDGPYVVAHIEGKIAGVLTNDFYFLPEEIEAVEESDGGIRFKEGDRVIVAHNPENSPYIERYLGLAGTITDVLDDRAYDYNVALDEREGLIDIAVADSEVESESTVEDPTEATSASPDAVVVDKDALIAAYQQLSTTHFATVMTALTINTNADAVYTGTEIADLLRTGIARELDKGLDLLEQAIPMLTTVEVSTPNPEED